MYLMHYNWFQSSTLLWRSLCREYNCPHTWCWCISEGAAQTLSGSAPQWAGPETNISAVAYSVLQITRRSNMSAEKKMTKLSRTSSVGSFRNNFSVDSFLVIVCVITSNKRIHCAVTEMFPWLICSQFECGSWLAIQTANLKILLKFWHFDCKWLYCSGSVTDDNKRAGAVPSHVLPGARLRCYW